MFKNTTLAFFTLNSSLSLFFFFFSLSKFHAVVIFFFLINLTLEMTYKLYQDICSKWHMHRWDFLFFFLYYDQYQYALQKFHFICATSLCFCQGLHVFIKPNFPNAIFTWLGEDSIWKNWEFTFSQSHQSMGVLVCQFRAVSWNYVSICQGHPLHLLMSRWILGHALFTWATPAYQAY